MAGGGCSPRGTLSSLREDNHQLDRVVGIGSLQKGSYRVILADRLTLPLAGGLKDFRPTVSASCRAHHKKPAEAGLLGGPY